MANITREQYAKSYGPTVGDQVRLGDTNLWIEITEDLTFGGDEAIFGGGKTIRESMLQGTTTSTQDAPDTVITNVIILDVAPALERGNGNAIVRADVGIKGGKIVAVGKAGNSDVMDGVTPGLEIGTSTDVISGEGKILTMRRRRHPRALHLPLGCHGSAVHRDHHADRRRRGTFRGVQGDHRDTWTAAPGEPAPQLRRPAGQRDAAGQGQHRQPGRPERAGTRGSPAVTRSTRTGAPLRQRWTPH